MKREADICEHAFTERRRGDKITRTWGTGGCGEADHDGELTAVIYHRGPDGVFRPHSITTSEAEYNADYSRTTGELYIHDSGSGSLSAYVGRFIDPVHALATTRIWIRESARIYTSSRRGKRREVKRSELADLGFLLIEGPEPQPFAGATDGDTMWCNTCGDNLPDDNDDREVHTYTCAMCQERAHMHGVGQLFVVADESESGVRTGLYRITRLPYYADGMISGHLYKNAIERLCDVLQDIRIEGDYPCGHVCDDCRDKINVTNTPRAA